MQFAIPVFNCLNIKTKMKSHWRQSHSSDIIVLSFQYLLYIDPLNSLIAFAVDINTLVRLVEQMHI